ncbi:MULTISPECIES: hypothetical protein [unclassified Neorhizobium]|uniref:hypothetical protein n=1 Tax=unclassified Neorhizobium TaxID=2629175 RepID=UPI001FF61BA8|nr:MULTISPECIES: hypothetical protein [unclassified Neorhizobium]MCJ9669421.1 hypothetical protein [Neorhizobium sp. SHOUNA12B]MCJ9745554.1 hypothetical protein [Neorhizobium sp. SHOUNA12A]
MKAVRFVVEQDDCANWIVHDKLGVIGGIFISKAAALQFARGEACRNMALILVADEGVIVDFTEIRHVSDRRAA